MAIVIINDKNRIAPDGWDFPLEELDYLLEEHDGETFVLKDGRLHEAEEAAVSTILTVSIDTASQTCTVEEKGAMPATYECSNDSLESTAHDAAEAVSDYLQGLG